ncbi:MAG: hypothetical protein OEU36_07060 [Gammaproteobacteria bacterium]|nr:hypothetical protein [Gammaproteobacteria bacterium]
MNDPRRMDQVRKLICDEAARIMAEEDVQDFQHAKRKASTRLALGPSHGWPSNLEVEQALSERLRLFSGAERICRLERMRWIVLDAMGLLSNYHPRVVGSVVSGNVTANTPVELHAFADTVEEVALFIEEHGIPVRPFDKRFRFGGDRCKEVPGLRLTADDVQVVVFVFGPVGLRESPLAPVDGKPMRRLRRDEFQQITWD